MSDDGGEFGSFLAGFVIGSLVGAATALVLAPQSGRETRSQITGRGRELVTATEDSFNQAVNTAGDYAYQASESAQQFASDVEEQARIVLDEGLRGSEAADGHQSAPSTSDGDAASPV